jgi:SAM-dependent methyltransferase
MSALVIVTQSFPRLFDVDVTSDLIAKYLVTQSPSALTPFAFSRAVVMYPASLELDGSSYGEAIPYDAGIGLERNQVSWRPLRARGFDEIFIFGIDPVVDHEEIILACYLEASRKIFLGKDGVRDLAEWQNDVRPDFSPRPVRLHRLPADQQREHMRAVHRWLADVLVKTDYDLPSAVPERSPETLIYRDPSLATDLANQAADLLPGLFNQPFSNLMCLDGSLVRSSDFYRSEANFVAAIDGMETVLDVGCGSGLLTCHLAASGRYADVLGIDASPERISGARLHAELNKSTARFEVMSMAEIGLPDRAVDVSVTSYSLEQSGEHLERCFSEIRRVTRRLIILFEPAVEYFPTLPSLLHVPSSGWATKFHAMLVNSGLAFAVRPFLFYHYYNCGAVFVIDLESREHPGLRYPELFKLGVEGWPGGVSIT